MKKLMIVASALQLGLLNWNPKGFLPFFPFVNCCPSYFKPAGK